METSSIISQLVTSKSVIITHVGRSSITCHDHEWNQLAGLEVAQETSEKIVFPGQEVGRVMEEIVHFPLKAC